MSAAGEERLRSLIELSVGLGDPELAILAEGNTSARIEGDRFWVKASGTSLREADRADAFVEVHATPLIEALRAPDEPGDDVARAVLQGAVADGGPAAAPSIETYVHAICIALGGADFVAHTHPTPVNALLCSRDGEAAYGGVLFPDEAVVCGPVPLLVPYAAPGIALGRAMLAPFERHMDEHGEPPRMVLLRNHGLVALGASSHEVSAITAMAVKAARIRLGTLAAGGPRFLDAAEAERLYGRVDERDRRERLR